MACFWITYSTGLEVVQRTNVFSSLHLFSHKHRRRSILSLKCIDGVKRRAPDVPLSAHVHMCVQWCQLHQAVHEEGFQQLLTLRMRSGPYICVSEQTCIRRSNQSGRSVMFGDGGLWIGLWACIHNGRYISLLIYWGENRYGPSLE